MAYDDEESERARLRTRWAQDRTLLANERTYASWIATGMGAIGVAIGLHAVFSEAEPQWVAKAISTIFLVIAVGLFLAARHNAMTTYQRLYDEEFEATPGRNFHRISIALVCGAVSIGAILWSL